MTEYTHVRTRKLTMTQVELVGKWIKEHAQGQVLICGIDPQLYIQQYAAERQGKRAIHELKVHFALPLDAQHFMMDWA